MEGIQSQFLSGMREERDPLTSGMKIESRFANGLSKVHI